MTGINLKIETPFAFISYAKEDLSFATRLYKNLNRDNLKPWLDIHHLPIGAKWENVIEKTINSCKFFLLILSKNSVGKRGFIQKEIRMAFEVVEQMPNENIFIIPLKIDDCEIPSILTKYHWVQYSNRTGYSKLKMTLINLLGSEYTLPQVTQIPIAKTRSTTRPKIKNSFDDDFRRFCQQSGNYTICRDYMGKIFVSNLHIGELRETFPRNQKPKVEVTKAKLDTILIKASQYKKPENIVKTIKVVDDKKYLLIAKNGNAVYADIEYVDYFTSKYYKCDLFVWSKNYISMIPIEHNNKFIGLIMPITPSI